ncbi:tyrosinase family protein [Paracoccus lutimaris]|uniref:Common central domain of tyrosinase n=1 Tax=Paracoccus lutimaris TaxID=1490030 RepID=A0A368Z550_9RHOB|nr:tyrosinase family protein [Paracoccus lutimaris]RCW87099.1 common central domain of tyrosinase [Paracoccus lutimaris]
MPSIQAGLTRRTLLGTAVAGGALLFAPRIARAEARYLRKNLASPEAEQDLAAYRKAVETMLQLPLDDRRNWYRIAFIHLLDCPHGNWWFTNWHRGFIGHFEQICRELSGYADFALPYWDWTDLPRLPETFFEGVLNPVESPLYIATHADFEAKLKPVMQAEWNSFSPAQLAQEQLRHYADFGALWSDAYSAFADQGNARLLTRDAPDLDPITRQAVSLPTVLSALRPTGFVKDPRTMVVGELYFNSPVTDSHHVMAGFSILEGQPHNKVHNNVGGTVSPEGLMTEFLSPLDPIFFMHHCNIDRLWDVWTRKQIRNGGPIGPVTSLTEQYDKEPYLFFVDRNGNPVTDKITAADYFAIGDFDYAYTAGSGDIAEEPPRLAAQAAIVNQAAALESASSATMEMVPDAALIASVDKSPDVSSQFARITIAPPQDVGGLSFDVFLHPTGTQPVLNPEGPEFAGSFEFFGTRLHHVAPVSFTIPIDAALDQMQKAGTLLAGQPFLVSVAIADDGEERSIGAELLSVEIGTF